MWSQFVEVFPKKMNMGGQIKKTYNYMSSLLRNENRKKIKKFHKMFYTFYFFNINPAFQ